MKGVLGGTMRKVLATAFMAWMVATPMELSAHCQVPCGIYDDHARIHAMEEDLATIAKAVTQLQENASKTGAQSLNQRVRWIQTKEEHASRIINVVSKYFLTQKIKRIDPSEKEAYKDYIDRLTACHGVLRKAMKTKQTVDHQAVRELEAALDALSALYPQG